MQDSQFREKYFGIRLIACGDPLKALPVARIHADVRSALASADFIGALEIGPLQDKVGGRDRAWDRQRFLWTFARYFCMVSMRACDKQVTHHASNHWWWFVVLRPGVEAAGTGSDPADHSRLFHSESDRASIHGLRVAGMAPAKRRTEEPGMLRLPADVARPGMASLVVAAT